MWLTSIQMSVWQCGPGVICLAANQNFFLHTITKAREFNRISTLHLVTVVMTWTFVFYKSCASEDSIAVSQFPLWEILSRRVLYDTAWSTDRQSPTSQSLWKEHVLEVFLSQEHPLQIQKQPLGGQWFESLMLKWKWQTCHEGGWPCLGVEGHGCISHVTWIRPCKICVWFSPHIMCNLWRNSW